MRNLSIERPPFDSGSVHLNVTDVEVEDGDQAIIKVGKVTVKATHVGVFSLLAYAFYKLTGKKEEQKTTPVEAVEEEEEVLSNYLM